MNSPINLKEKKTHKISIIIPCYDESKNIDNLFSELKRSCNKISNCDWHLIFVDDGSKDNTSNFISLNLEENKSWCSGTLIILSRNFGKEAALIAGLDVCNDDACIIMDADLQDPPNLINAMINYWLNGAEVVNAQRKDRKSDSKLKRITSSLFYYIFKNSSNLDIQVDASDFRLIDRSVVNAIKSCRESIRFSKGFFAWAGFKNVNINYSRPKRIEGKTKWNFWQLWNYALDGIFNFSTAPLKFWFYCGILITIISFILALRSTLFAVFTNNVPPGYSSLFVATTFLGGVQLIGIGIVGEYLGRVYFETKRRPLYVTRKVKKIEKV